MFRLNLLRLEGCLLNRFTDTIRRCPPSSPLLAFLRAVTAAGSGGRSSPIAGFTFCRRWISQYQFRTKKECYYPDRTAEMRRSGSKLQSAAVVKPQHQRGLPKDYYYKVLGVNRYATVQQIRSAFYALAKRYHPDSTHSEQKLKHFQELSNAYNILTDETKRLEYDQLGGINDEQAFLQQAGNPMNVDMAQITNEPKGNSQQGALTTEERQQLTTNEFDLPLSFSEATIGCKKRVDLRYLKKCEECRGKSQLMANRDLGKEPCRRCSGTGKLTVKTPTYTSVTACSLCKGKRFTNRNDCDTCENRGYIVSNVQVLVSVPSGSKNGNVITIDNPATKQRVHYHLKVPDSEYFRRVGNDIHTDKILKISDAILGGTFTVRGLYENVEVRVEPGTQSHTQLVLANKGVRSHEGVGNHIVTLKVRIPKNLSVKQRQLVLALAQAEQPVFEYQSKTD